MTTTQTQFGGYQATKSPDGTLTIHRVPIFVECSRGSVDFDAQWIAAAVIKAKQAESEGYLPPLHVRHHEDGPGPDDVRPAGFFRILEASPITFKGTRRLAVFADLVITDPTVEADVLSKRLPYRSVEIFDVEAPAIDSLALLDHEAPYLELPMLMVADVKTGTSVPNRADALSFASATFGNPWLDRASQSDGPVVACFRRGHSAHLFYEDSMPNPKKEDEKMADTEKKEGEQMQEGTMLDVAALVKAIEDGSISVADMDAILAAIQKQRTAAMPEAEVEEAPAMAAPAADPKAAMAKGEMDEAMARLRGELDAQKARLNERDAADKRRDDVSVALQRLAGRPLGSDLEQRLVAFHKDHGAQAFKAYVDSMAQTFGALAGADEETLAAFAGQSTKAPEVALSYQAAGTDAVEKAARFAREWQDLSARGVTRMGQDRYVELNMERAGVKLAKRG